MRQILVFCDGSCEPCNPGGYATWGWVAFQGGKEISHGSGCIGHGAGMSNNVAEYAAMLEVLRRAAEKGISVSIHTDSQLVVNQVNGKWAVRAPHLQPLRSEASTLLRSTDSTLTWVPREENMRADALSKQAYREATRAGGLHGANRG